jgi:hypothetical protein
MIRRQCFAVGVVAALLLAPPVPAEEGARSVGTPDHEVERLYEAWLKALEEPRTRLSSGHLQMSNPHFRAIVAKGPKAVPFLIGRLESARAPDTASFVMAALSRITRARPFSREEARGMSTNARAKAWVIWFRNLEQNTSSQFKERAAAWRRFTEAGKPALWKETTFYVPDMGELQTRKELTEAGTAYEAILDLGIAGLPLLVERLRLGETRFIPIFEEITGSRPAVHGPNAETTSHNCVAWWDRNKDDWIVGKP